METRIKLVRWYKASYRQVTGKFKIDGDVNSSKEQIGRKCRPFSVRLKPRSFLIRFEQNDRNSTKNEKRERSDTFTGIMKLYCVCKDCKEERRAELHKHISICSAQTFTKKARKVQHVDAYRLLRLVRKESNLKCLKPLQKGIIRCRVQCS